MLYGGPLGTYLSGLSANSGASNTHATTNTPHTSNAYSGSNYSGSGLRRSGSRYRPTGSNNRSLTNSTSVSATSYGNASFSNYYTPQVRRKYGTNEADNLKSVNRYNTRPTTKPSTSPGSSGLASSGAPHSVSGSTTPTVFHYSRWSPLKSSNTSNYGASALGTSASWNSELSSIASSPVDYKRLYEAEKVATDELRSEVIQAQDEMKELKAKIDSVLQNRRISGADKRKIERRISECEEELKTLDKLRAESEKLRAEHRALVRVVSRLNREQ